MNILKRGVGLTLSETGRKDRRYKAVLLQDEITGDWYAVSDTRRWKLLTAAVTYFKGQPGDEVVILIPKNSKSLWASVENIIKK